MEQAMIHPNAAPAPNFGFRRQTPDSAYSSRMLFGQESDTFIGQPFRQDPHQALRQQMWDLMLPGEHWASRGRMLGLCTGLQHLGVKNIEGQDSSAKRQSGKWHTAEWRAKNNAFKIRRAFRKELEYHERAFERLGTKPRFEKFVSFIQTLQGLLKEHDAEKLTVIANTAAEILEKHDAQPMRVRLYGKLYALFWQDNHLVALHGIDPPRN
jgi:hypothetical protein